jgi:hypothetical protein
LFCDWLLLLLLELLPRRPWADVELATANNVMAARATDKPMNFEVDMEASDR